MSDTSPSLSLPLAPSAYDDRRFGQSDYRTLRRAFLTLESGRTVSAAWLARRSSLNADTVKRILKGHKIMLKTGLKLARGLGRSPYLMEQQLDRLREAARAAGIYPPPGLHKHGRPRTAAQGVTG